MAIEIERKYLVCGEFKSLATSSVHVAQGYLSREGRATIRVRIMDDKAYITIKGPSLDGGLSRYELEQPIPLPDGQQLLRLCYPHIIEKRRYYIPCGAHMCEVDVFEGANEGLIVAEIELQHPTDQHDALPFLGEEVTGQTRYYNAALSKLPFTQWK